MTPQTTQPESNGKPRCRLNALRLGLTGQVYVLTEDEAPRFQKHHAAIREHYQPVGPIEASLVDQIANGIWRLQRAQSIEEGIFALDSAPDAPGLPSPAPPALGSRSTKPSTSSANTNAASNVRSTAPKPNSPRSNPSANTKPPMDMDRAVALHRLAKSEGKPYDPSFFQTPLAHARVRFFTRSSSRRSRAPRSRVPTTAAHDPDAKTTESSIKEAGEARFPAVNPRGAVRNRPYCRRSLTFCKNPSAR